jgi:diguanylate cyclase (GGDEF)-like protein
MIARTPSAAQELVPLAERLRHLRIFRLVASALVIAGWLTLPGVRDAAGDAMPLATGAWLALSLGVDGVWRLARRRALGVVGLSLMIDGIFLSWLAYVATPFETPLRHLLLVHLVAVCLLASFQTGMRLAMWQSLLLLAAYHAHEAGLFADGRPSVFGAGEYRTVMAWIVVLWVVAVVTSTYGAVNERELRRRRYDLEALGRLSSRLEQRADAEAVAAALVDAVADDFGFGRVLVFGGPEGRLSLLHATGAGTAVGGAPVAAGPVMQAVVGANSPVLLSKLRPGEDPAFEALLPAAGNLVLVPMHADGDAVGVLVCEHGMRGGSRVERRVVSMLERYAAHTAHALHNAWLVEQLEHSATTDALTGVANRRTFDAALTREIARSTRTGEDVALLLLDADHFKTINDTLGHVMGDRVLKAIAQALQAECRASDTFARYGGEEFAAILPGLDGPAAMAVADRMRLVVANLSMPTSVTLSVGVAAFPDAAPDPLSLVAAADSALYAAKAAGRNRCVLAGPVQTSVSAQSAPPDADQKV